MVRVRRRPSLRSLLLAFLITGSCGSADSARESLGDKPTAELRGTRLANPIPRPHFSLIDTEGVEFDFHARTEGYATLLFFGYTHCPDVCPIHMANIAAALGQVGWQTRHRVKVVFVTTDPDRDTPERIREWLDRFDPTFVGLRGTVEEVAAIQDDLNLPPSVIPSKPTAGYEVGHAAQVLAFSPSGTATVAYPFGTRQADWVHDLPLLVTTRGSEVAER
jgi:protein SCO1/2